MAGSSTSMSSGALKHAESPGQPDRESAVLGLEALAHRVGEVGGDTPVAAAEALGVTPEVHERGDHRMRSAAGRELHHGERRIDDPSTGRGREQRIASEHFAIGDAEAVILGVESEAQARGVGRREPDPGFLEIGRRLVDATGCRRIHVIQVSGVDARGQRVRAPESERVRSLVLVGTGHDGIIDGRRGRDQRADRLDFVPEVADEIERDDRHAPAVAVDDDASRPQPIVVITRAPPGREARQPYGIGVIDHRRQPEARGVGRGEVWRDRRDVELAGTDSQVFGRRRTNREYERSHEKTHDAEREGPYTKHADVSLWRAQCRSNVTPTAECGRRPSRRPAVRRPVGRPTPRPSGRIWGSSAP